MARTTRPATRVGVWGNALVFGGALFLLLLLVGLVEGNGVLIGASIPPFIVSVLVSTYCLNRKMQGKTIKYGWFWLVLGLALFQTGIAAYTDYLDREVMEGIKVLQESGKLDSWKEDGNGGNYDYSLHRDESVQDAGREKRQFSYRDIRFECCSDWDIMTGEIDSDWYYIAVKGVDFAAMVNVCKANYDMSVDNLYSDLFTSMMQEMETVIVGDVFDIRCGLNGMYAGIGFYCRSRDGLLNEYLAFLIDSRTVVIVTKEVQNKADLETSAANLIDSTLVYGTSGLNR